MKKVKEGGMKERRKEGRGEGGRKKKGKWEEGERSKGGKRM